MYETVALAAPVAVDPTFEAALPADEVDDDAGRLARALRRWMSELPRRGSG